MTQGPVGPLAQQVEDDIFLTPRVLDQRAFEDLAGSLKGIVRDAVQQGEALVASTGDVKLLGQQLKDATRELQQRVDSAVRVVPTLDQRVAKVEQALDRAESSLNAKEAIVRELTSKEISIDKERLALMVEEHLSAIVKDKLASFSERLVSKALEAGPVASRELEATMRRLKDVHDKAGVATTAAEQRVASLKTQADATAASIVSGVQGKADQLISEAEARSGAIVSQAQGHASALFAEAQSKVESMLASFEDHAQQIARQAHEPLEQILRTAPARIAECEDRAGLIVAELERRLERFKAVAGEAAKLANPVETERFITTANETTNRATTTLNRLHEGVEQAEEFSRQLATLSQQAQTAREHLTHDVDVHVGAINAIEKRLSEIGSKQEALRTMLEQALSKAQEADATIEEQAAKCAQTVEQAAQPAMQRLGMQAQQVGAWLQNLLQQSADVGHRLERVMSEARATASGKTPGKHS